MGGTRARPAAQTGTPANSMRQRRSYLGVILAETRAGVRRVLLVGAGAGWFPKLPCPALAVRQLAEALDDITRTRPRPGAWSRPAATTAGAPWPSSTGRSWALLAGPRQRHPDRRRARPGDGSAPGAPRWRYCQASPASLDLGMPHMFLGIPHQLFCIPARFLHPKPAFLHPSPLFRASGSNSIEMP